MGFRVRDVETRQVVPGIPTPRLIEAGGGESFFQPGDIKSGGVWYLHEPGTRHVSPDGQYTRVRIEHTDDYRVDVEIRPVGPDGVEPAEDNYFIVEAASEPEAFQLARAAASEYVENVFGVDYGHELTIISARKGVSI